MAKKKKIELKEEGVLNIKHTDPILSSKEENLSSKEEKINVSTSGYIQWSIANDNVYIPTFSTSHTVPAGVYTIDSNQNMGVFLTKQKIIMGEDVLELPMEEIDEIVGDIEDFWARKHLFKKYKMVYKRGILLHGVPGGGKSCLIQILTNRIVKRDGVVFTLCNEKDIDLFVTFSQTFRQIEPERPLMVIIEDIDNVVNQGNGLLSSLLNVLDGVNQIDNVVYVATTNYPERLQERVANRPSRFDRMYEIKLPNAKVREFFIRHKLHPEDIEKIDMQKWLDLTDGLTMSHIKEIIVSTMILGKNIDDVCEHFGMMKRPKSSRSQHQKVGFGS